MTEPTETARRLSVQHADALWDAVAIPGPRTPTFVEQHERVCRAVADIFDEMTCATVDRATVLREAADAVAALDRRKTVIYADTIRDAWEEGRDEGADELRRMAAESAPADTTKQGDGYTQSVIYEVVGDWGVDSADSAEGARAAVAKWLRAYPKCGAHAQQRIVRDWPDGSEFYGPWTDLPEPPAAAQQPKEA